jgi:hypothetical protein
MPGNIKHALLKSIDFGSFFLFLLLPGPFDGSIDFGSFFVFLLLPGPSARVSSGSCLWVLRFFN